MEVRQAFILAAGYGTRLRPLTLNTPKPLLPIGGKPLLSYHFENFKKNGIKKIFINSFYLSDQIDDFIKKYDKLNILVSREEGEILGTAGGVMKQLENLDDVFLVVYGDNLTNFDYYQYFKFLEGKEFDVSVVLYRENNIREKGMAVLDERGYITKFIEKPKQEEIVSNLANAGIYLIKKDIFKKYCPSNGFFDFGHDLFPLLIKDGKKILSYTCENYLLDIGNMEKYSEANEYVSKNPNLFRF